jgi:hypothetical protein
MLPDKVTGVLKHYGTLFRDTPRLLWKASDTVSRLLLFAVLIAGLVGYGAGIPAWVLVALLVFLVVIGLAVAEYDRHEAWKKDSLFWRKQVMKGLENDAELNKRKMGWDEIEEAINEGRDKIYLPLRTTSTGSNSEWISAIDEWDARTIARLEKYFPAELDFYRAEIQFVEHLPDPRERLQTIMDIKLDRLSTIYRRSLGLEDGKTVSNSPK